MLDEIRAFYGSARNDLLGEPYRGRKRVFHAADLVAEDAFYLPEEKFYKLVKGLMGFDFNIYEVRDWRSVRGKIVRVQGDFFIAPVKIFGENVKRDVLRFLYSIGVMNRISEVASRIFDTFYDQCRMTSWGLTVNKVVHRYTAGELEWRSEIPDDPILKTVISLWVRMNEEALAFLPRFMKAKLRKYLNPSKFWGLIRELSEMEYEAARVLVKRMYKIYTMYLDKFRVLFKRRYGVVPEFLKKRKYLKGVYLREIRSMVGDLRERVSVITQELWSRWAVTRSLLLKLDTWLYIWDLKLILKRLTDSSIVKLIDDYLKGVETTLEDLISPILEYYALRETDIKSITEEMNRVLTWKRVANRERKFKLIVSRGRDRPGHHLEVKGVLFQVRLLTLVNGVGEDMASRLADGIRTLVDYCNKIYRNEYGVLSMRTLIPMWGREYSVFPYVTPLLPRSNWVFVILTLREQDVTVKHEEHGEITLTLPPGVWVFGLL